MTETTSTPAPNDIDINVTPNPTGSASMFNGGYAPGMYSNNGFGNNGTMEGLLLASMLRNGNGGLFGGNGNGNGFMENISEKIVTNAASTAQALTAATQAQNLAAIEATNRGITETLRQASDTRADVNRASGDIRLSASQSESRLGSAIETNGGESRLSGVQSESRLATAVATGISDTRRDIAQAQTELHSTLEARTAELRNTAAVNASAAMLEIERAKFETVKAQCAIERQASDNLGAIQLEAEKNKHHLSKQLSECCCEIKGAVHHEGEETRGLIVQNELAELRAEKLALQNALGEARERARRGDDDRNNDHITRIVNILNANANTGTQDPYRTTATK